MNIKLQKKRPTHTFTFMVILDTQFKATDSNNWAWPAGLSEPQIGVPWTSVSQPDHTGYSGGNCEVEG